MATEGPMIHDGAQCVASANYWNPGTPLFGPNGSGQFLAVNISAARTVAIQTSIGGIFYGILQNTPALGQAADVALPGSITKAVAGAAIAAGALVMVEATNGRLITWTAGTLYYVAGIALEAAGAANNIFTMLLYPPMGHNVT
jgi:hypothetical protein